MIGYLQGKVAVLGLEYCYLEVNGVGYRVFIPGSSREKLATGAQVQLFTHLHVREDALLLYGFLTQQEYEVFLLLLSVTGIGPKAALAILSVMNPAQFIMAIGQQDLSALTRVSGIGKKTAERMVLELKDKVAGLSGAAAAVLPAAVPVGSGGSMDIQREALQALLALGYTQQEIMPVLKKLPADQGDTMSVEQAVKLALKEFAARR